MKELREYFVGIGKVKGYIFNQIEKTEYAYIYEVVGNDNSIHYEIFKRSVNTYYNCISYPSDKAFGVWAWTTQSLERAEDILNGLELDGLLKDEW